MLLLTAAAATMLQATLPVRAERRALAVVRIEQGVVLWFADLERDQPQRLRTTQVAASDGALQPARLVEFE